MCYTGGVTVRMTKWAAAARAGFVALCAGALCGCYSMDAASSDALRGSSVSASGERPVEHVVVSNYGWYLFNFVPLVCGNAEPGAAFPWAFFSDQVTAPLLHDRLMQRAAARRANVKDLACFRDDQVFFTFPGTQFQVPVPYLLCFREIQFSGVFVARTEETL